MLNHSFLNKYTGQLIDSQRFQLLMETQFFAYFNQEIMINVEALAEKYQQLYHYHTEYPTIETLHLLISDGNLPIMLFKAYPLNRHTFLLDLGVIHPEYRRQGLCSDLINAVLTYTKELGYSSVISQHSPTNNPILIVQLKLGFHFTKMQISPAFGTEIELCYFHNPDLKLAYQYRCGDLTMNNNLLENSYGTLNKFFTGSKCF